MQQSVINIDPETMGGLPVFVGTRVPIQFMFEYLKNGGTIREFTESFPTVELHQAEELLSYSLEKTIGKEAIVEKWI